MDFGGSLLKTIFGTLDTEDALKFSQAINDVQTDEKQLAHLMKDNIHVIKSTISTFNSSINKVTENENHLLENIKTLHSIMETISNSNDKLEIKSQTNSLLNSLESIILTLSLDIDDISNAVLFAKLNILHPTVLSPHQLYNELDKNRHNLPKHNELPVSLTIQNIHEIIDLSKLICYYHSNRVIVVVKIPLVLPQVYNLYNVVPLPTPYDITKPDTYALIAPTDSYVAITKDHMFYSLINDIKKCQVISEKCYVCALTNVYSTIANPICETVFLTEAVKTLPEICTTRLIHGVIDVFHKIKGNRWIFVQSEPGKCHITCNNQPDDIEVVLFGTGILTLPKTCKAFYKTLQFTSSSESIIANITNKVSDFNIVQDDCCEKIRLNKTLGKLPFIKLENINNLDSLVHASTHLNLFEKELNKLENPTHFQQYSTHYISVTYIISTLFLLYILYRVRNWLCCNQSPQDKTGCCVQIFNQCHNRKTELPPTHMIVMKEPTEETCSSEEDRCTPSPVKRNILVTHKTHSQ
ncbi:uncharacterized protein LOC134670516 [Cydia fagiglandana]|uniref:uncharacterized protein LOC134670516 n=1 Tax=Cydia fagiglandana TaxID=1458189 RepID=UPI002FEDEB66